MNLKKTQEFVYFQNKARHYANLRSIKPAVKTHRETRYSTIDDPGRLPYFKRYDMERENEGLINRLTDILSAQHTEIEKQGYTRYNRGFVPKSHLSIEQRKAEAQIEEDNNILAHKVLSSRPSVGTIQNWNTRAQELRERKRIVSKFTERRTSKATLVLNSSANFVPEHYRSFLSPLSPSPSPEDSYTVKVGIQQLFQLPKLKKMRGSLTKIPGDQKMLL